MHCYHIIPKGGTWLLRREGGLRRDEAFSRRKKAIHAGRRMLRLVGGTLVIHGKRGNVKKKQILKPVPVFLHSRPPALYGPGFSPGTPAVL